MGMPKNPGAIDLMLNIPGEDTSAMYDFMKPLLMDEESRNVFKMPAQYMFRNIPDAGKRDDYIAYTVEQMDKHGIAMAMLAVSETDCSLYA